MSFISELKRRNVFKVAVAYAIVAWLLIQVVGAVLPTFEAPQWVVKTITFVILLGFPLALVLAWAYEMTPEGLKAATDVEPHESITHATGQKLNYGILALLALAVGFMAIDQYVLAPGDQVAPGQSPTLATPQASNAQAGPIAAVQRWDLTIEGTQTLGNSGLRAEVAISPHGDRIAYSANIGDGTQLYMRVLNQFEAQSIPGTEGGRTPIFSPDGEWVVFNSNLGNILKKVSVRGGPPQTLNEELHRVYGGAWGEDDSLVISTTDGTSVLSGFLARIPGAGGNLEVLTTPEAGTSHLFPSILPGGTDILFTNRLLEAPASEASISILSLDSGEWRPLIAGGHNARYVDTGHIIFARADSLWAVPFDLERREISGGETPLVDGVQMNNRLGFAPYDFSNEGLFVYVRGEEALGIGTGGARRDLYWVDHEGQEVAQTFESRIYLDPRLSPDGQRLAVRIVGENNQDIYVLDLARGSSSRLTFDPADDSHPIWTPDGQYIIYASERSEPGIFKRPANGTGQAERLVTGPFIADAISPDGRQVIMRRYGNANWDMVTLSLENNPEVQTLIRTEYNEGNSALSPDGKWLAYNSDETGRGEIYVRPFPDIDDGKWQISSSGGFQALWGPDGNFLYFRNAGDNDVAQFYRANITTDPSFSASAPIEIFQADYAIGNPSWDISPDGQRFLVMSELRAGDLIQNRASIAFVDNWFEELKRLAPREGQ